MTTVNNIKDSYSGYVELAMAIISQAAKDLNCNNLQYRREASRFFNPKKDNILTDFFDINCKKVLQNKMK